MTDLSRRALLAGLSAALGPSLPFGPARATEGPVPRPPTAARHPSWWTSQAAGGGRARRAARCGC